MLANASLSPRHLRLNHWCSGCYKRFYNITPRDPLLQHFAYVTMQFLSDSLSVSHPGYLCPGCLFTSLVENVSKSRRHDEGRLRMYGSIPD